MTEQPALWTEPPPPTPAQLRRAELAAIRAHHAEVLAALELERCSSPACRLELGHTQPCSHRPQPRPCCLARSCDPSAPHP
jgi:hypothetical protein